MADRPYERVMFGPYLGDADSWDDAGFHPERSNQPVELLQLYAALRAESDICNGGFHQFFHNSTGVCAPEALDAFRLLGLDDTAALFEKGIRFFGEPYPRSQKERTRMLDAVPGAYHEARSVWDPFAKLNEPFYATLRDPYEGGFNERFYRAADELAIKYLPDELK